MTTILRRRGRVAAAALLALLALAVLAPAVSGAASYILERDGRSAEVTTRLLARREVFDLSEVAAFLGMSVTRDRKRVELAAERGVIALQLGRAVVHVNGQPVLLGSEAEVEDGRFWVPLDFLTRAVPRFLDEEARHDPQARAVRYERRGGGVACAAYDDRVRITLRRPASAAAPEITSEGSRRVIRLPGARLPEGPVACEASPALAEAVVTAAGGASELAITVGPRFGGLELQDVPADGTLLVDILLLAEAAPGAATASVPSSAPTPPAADDVFDTFVLDAGHGGEDEGARGPGGLLEKQVALEVAQRLARSLRAAGLQVVMTRSSDRAIPLLERTEIANRERADLFVSLHANASPAKDARGAETYFLHVDATDEAARSLAALENDATGLRARGGGGGDLEMLLWDMAQQQYLEESSRLADKVQRELNEELGTRDRGVKQANFLVLRGATMPAVLVEVGFISNPEEEKRLRSDEYQAKAAEAIARAILAFRDARSSVSGP